LPVNWLPSQADARSFRFVSRDQLDERPVASPRGLGLWRHASPLVSAVSQVSTLLAESPSTDSSSEPPRFWRQAFPVVCDLSHGFDFGGIGKSGFPPSYEEFWQDSRPGPPASSRRPALCVGRHPKMQARGFPSSTEYVYGGLLPVQCCSRLDPACFGFGFAAYREPRRCGSGPRPVRLTGLQAACAAAPLDTRIFIHGPAGSGKTTVGVERLRHLLSQCGRKSSVIVLTPQRTLHRPYLQVARSGQLDPGTQPAAYTIGGLARRLCELFWPLVVEKAGFQHAERPPFFLTLESAQYYMARVVEPLLGAGYFQTVTMDRNRLYAQILDSLNKAAVVGFPHAQIGARLSAAWVGDPAQRRIYTEAQECATRFRQFCLAHNLLDFSLQFEIFYDYLWPERSVAQYLRSTFQHLIYDNVEEDVPRAHDVIREWLPELESALLIYDEQAGYRGFLGADPQTGWQLRESCTQATAMAESFVMPPEIKGFAIALAAAIHQPKGRAPGPSRAPSSAASSATLRLISARFFPELLDRVAEEASRLMENPQVSPSDVAIVGPYFSDSLRFAMISRLQAAGLPVRTYRPSRSLRDEMATRSLLVLSKLAHPQWDLRPARSDVAGALMVALGMDLVRAHLLAEIVFRKDFALSAFEAINPEMQERITLQHGKRYARLRDWLLSYRSGLPLTLDHFLSRIFGEVLSQPGFGFHGRLDEGRTVGSLVQSVRQFRQAMEQSLMDKDDPDLDVSQEYVRVLSSGMLAAQYIESWTPTPEDSILLSPAHSFLMMNQPVSFQFWLDTGSNGWFQRLDQPLTHTRVLSRSWPVANRWSVSDEEFANIDGMARLVTGLLRRCSQAVFLCGCELSESGFEQRGELALALEQVMHA
jgi:hypothetical protein